MSYKKITVFLLTAVFFLGLSGCTGTENHNPRNPKEEISIPMILTVDPSTGRKNEEHVVKAFNQAYAGTYQVDVEWIMETEEEYRKNLKRLNVTDQLPSVITDLRTLPSFYQMMVEENRMEDLSPYIQNDKEWKDSIETAVLEACSEPDGSIYLAPLSTAAFSCSGVFWNKHLFQEAGISEFPQTWEEFWNCCEKLQSHGVTPLALHTEGTAWSPMQFATAELADSKEGSAFMKKLFPDSYHNPHGLQLAETLKKLFQYTSDDALHADFDVAYTNFISGKAAMIANGYWMIDQIPEDFITQVHFSPFPGNKLISSPETFGWAVISDYKKEIKEGAIEFLKFRTKYNKYEKELFLNKKIPGINQLLTDYIDAYNSEPQIVPNYQVKWNSLLQEQTLGEYIPKLVNGEITTEEFTLMEDESIRQFQKESR